MTIEFLEQGKAFKSWVQETLKPDFYLQNQTICGRTLGPHQLQFGTLWSLEVQGGNECLGKFGVSITLKSPDLTTNDTVID